MATPLTDSINALTTYANEVTGASDTNLSDAVHTLASGYGGGGGAVSAPKKDVNFIDYDGIILHSYTATEALALTALPDNPSHDGLTAQGWNWSLADMKSQVQSIGKCDIGQMYITDDGKTRIYVHFEEGRTSPRFGIGVNGSVEIDWGDGSNTETLTGTSLTTVTTVQHIYAPGDYVIKLTVVNGSFSFFGVSGTSHILEKSTALTPNASGVYTNAVRKIELGNGITNIGTYAFYNCYSLSAITVPAGVTSLETYAFYNCYSLSAITVPAGVTRIGTYAFYNCYSLSAITVPAGVTNIGDRAFFNCYSLSAITVPAGVTRIGTYAFYNCYSLSAITVPAGVTSLETYAFGNCYGMAEYHFLPTEPPSITNTNVFSNIQSDCIIYVPYSEDHSILEAYKTATKWSTYASRMQEEAA